MIYNCTFSYWTPHTCPELESLTQKSYRLKFSDHFLAYVQFSMYFIYTGVTPPLPDSKVIPVEKRLWVRATSKCLWQSRWHLYFPFPSAYTFITADKFIRRKCRCGTAHLFSGDMNLTYYNINFSLLHKNKVGTLVLVQL